MTDKLYIILQWMLFYNLKMLANKITIKIKIFKSSSQLMYIVKLTKI